MAGRYVRIKREALLVLGACCLLWAQIPPLEAAPLPPPTPPNSEIINLALRQALNLKFNDAYLTAEQLQDQHQPTFGSEWLRGILVYLQLQWQPRPLSSTSEMGRKALQSVLTAGKAHLSSTQPEPWLQVMLGLAAVFEALLPPQAPPWKRLQGLSEGQTWLQKARIAHADTADAHLGLGIIALEQSQTAAPLRLLTRQVADPDGNSSLISKAVRHLQQAAETSRFSQDLARVFLIRLYERERRHPEALTLGKLMHTRFPDNGRFALSLGRAQCRLSQRSDCALTLERLAARLTTTPSLLAQRDDRFDLYYQWATVLNDLGRDDEAFTAYRKAINQDPRATKDETLWAKFYLANLYQRKGKLKTARQLYQTLLRGRQVEDLHDQARRRLTHLR